MKKIIRTNNLQKALEDYDALKGQAVSYVSVLPVSPDIRNSVYCKQTTTDVEDSLNITVESLIQDYAEETETADHYVIPVTYTVEYLGIAVRAIEVSGDVAIMYEDEDFTTALAASFNLEDKYTFAVTTHVTEMAYYMGDVTNQTLHPVVSFGVIAEVNKRIDVVERELDTKVDVSALVQLDTKIDNSYNTLDNKIDNSFNTLDTKIDNNYNTLDNKIDNEISNLAVNFTTNNLVANVATVNNAVIGNAQVNNFDVSSIIANGSTGTDGQVLGKVNGNVEWFSPSLDTNDFKVNYLTVNNDATVNGNNFTHKGFDVTSMTVISEADYNNLGWEYRNSALYMTTPNGNMYFHGIRYAATYVPPKTYTAYVDLPLMANNKTTLTTSTLTFTSGAVTNSFVNGGAYNGIKEKSPFVDGWNNSAPIGTQANTGSIITNADKLYITNAACMYSYCENLTDTFITNPSLITGAPANYDPMKYCTNMHGAFECCYNFNQPITIPDSVIDASNMLRTDSLFNQPVIIPNGVRNVSFMLSNCFNFNQPITIPDSVIDATTFLGYPYGSNPPRRGFIFNQPITIGNNVENMFFSFAACSNFNQSITIPSSVTNLYLTFSWCNTLKNSSVPIHISHNIALGNTSNYIYNMLVNGGCGITFDPSRILNDA